jgi:tetratricopeptide (TPR) repeat protein
MNTYWQTISADESYVGSQRAVKRGEFKKALNLANKSVRKNPREPRYYYSRAKVLLASTVNLNEEEKQNTKQNALRDFRHAQELNPKNLVTLRNIVPLYYYLAINNLEEVSLDDNTDHTFFEITKEYYQNIKHYSPTDVGIYALLAKYEKRLGLTDELNESVDNIQRLRPDLLQWYFTP